MSELGGADGTVDGTGDGAVDEPGGGINSGGNITVVGVEESAPHNKAVHTGQGERVLPR